MSRSAEPHQASKLGTSSTSSGGFTTRRINIDLTRVAYSLLRVLLALVILVQAEAIIESYAQYWTYNFDSVPVEELVEDAEVVQALLLTVAALIASLIGFPLIGWLAVVKQSRSLATLFAMLSVSWAIYVATFAATMPAVNVAFVSGQAALSMFYAFAVLSRAVETKSDFVSDCCVDQKIK
jgi:hypothetical protein